MPDDDVQREDKSRSQAKREHRELKELGVRLVGLSKGQLRAIPLSEKTHEAILAARGQTRGALQRHYRYLASLIAHEDVPAIRAALAGELQPHADEVAALHEAERWRDLLLAADEHRLVEFVERYPDCDRTQLRRLVRNAGRERELGKPPKSARELFRYVRELLDSDQRER